MKHLLLILLLFSSLYSQSFYDFSAKDIDGKTISMSEYKNKIVLVVNVASKCKYTPQYEGLQKLYDDYKTQGFVVLGFPSNEFREQEPASNTEIKFFCTSTYKVDFPMFEKVKVNGKSTLPLYKYLKKEQTGILWTESIKWNFTKFLVDKKGNVLKRYGSSTTPSEIEKDISALLKN